MTFDQYKFLYGIITFEGKEYALTKDAEIDDTLLPSYKNYHEAKDGEEYAFMMSAPVIDKDGNRFEAQWLFFAVKGEEKPLEDYDYSEVHSILEV